MYQEQTPWKGTVYADSPGLEVYPIQMKTDVHSNLARNQRIYERDKIIKIISMNHQYLVWRTGFFCFCFPWKYCGRLLRCSALPRIYRDVISSRSSIQCLSLFPELSLSPLLSVPWMSSSSALRLPLIQKHFSIGHYLFSRSLALLSWSLTEYGFIPQTIPNL